MAMSEEYKPAPARAAPDPLAPRTALPSRPITARNRQPLVHSPPQRHSLLKPEDAEPMDTSRQILPSSESPMASPTKPSGQGTPSEAGSQSKVATSPQSGQVCRYVRTMC